MASPDEVRETLAAVIEHKVWVQNNLFYDISSVPVAVKMLSDGELRGKATVIIDRETQEQHNPAML